MKMANRMFPKRLFPRIGFPVGIPKKPRVTIKWRKYLKPRKLDNLYRQRNEKKQGRRYKKSPVKNYISRYFYTYSYIGMKTSVHTDRPRLSGRVGPR